MVDNNEKNSAYEQLLENDFGLTSVKNMRLFKSGGQIVQDISSQLTKPDICLGVLKKLQAQSFFHKFAL